MNDIIKKIQYQITQNPILIYIKGTPESPACGFSYKAIQALYDCDAVFLYIDILKHPDIRVELPNYSNWPTFPQLWIDTKLIGGCDIILEMHKKGELKTLIQDTMDKYNIKNKNVL